MHFRVPEGHETPNSAHPDLPPLAHSGMHEKNTQHTFVARLNVIGHCAVFNVNHVYVFLFYLTIESVNGMHIYRTAVFKLLFDFNFNGSMCRKVRCSYCALRYRADFLSALIRCLASDLLSMT